MQREVILIFGQTGSGKTFHARELARTYPRVLVATPYPEDFSPIPYVTDYGDLLAYLENVRAFQGAPFRVSYDFRPEELDLAPATALRLPSSLLVLEEGDRFDIDEPELSEVIFRGRHSAISVLYISLHPRICPTEIRRQATKIISYRQIFPDDVAWLAEVVGEEAFKLPELSGPPNKPPNPYLYWTQSEGAKIIYPSGPPKALTEK